MKSDLVWVKRNYCQRKAALYFTPLSSHYILGLEMLNFCWLMTQRESVFKWTTVGQFPHLCSSSCLDFEVGGGDNIVYKWTKGES